MAMMVGDLYPHSSGSASLGVEQVNGIGGMSNDIRPFSHVHINSGIFHEALHGQSGIIRYTGTEFQQSLDGGLTFTALGAGGGVADLQEAYDGGNEIDHVVNPVTNAYEGIIVRETVPGIVPQTVFTATDNHFGIAVSGHTLTPNDPNSAAFTKMTSMGWVIKGSGQPGFQAPAISLGYVNNNDAGATMLCQGTLLFSVASGLVINNGVNSFAITGGDDILVRSSEQITLRAFSTLFTTSGELTYQFGPNEAWHTSPSHTTDKFPLPHSGQVLQMILENSLQNINGEDGPSITVNGVNGVSVITGTDEITIDGAGASGAGGGGGVTNLQEAYEGGQLITASAAEGGPVHIAGSDHFGLRLDQTENDHPHILMSGVFDLVTAGANTPGALWMQNHTGGVAGQADGVTITDSDVAAAKSMGISTIFMNTNGSGITTVRTASGVAQFFNLTPSTAIDENGINVPLLNQTVFDQHYAIGASSGVKLFISGMYKISYVSTFEKTQGNLAQVIESELHFNDEQGQTFRLLGSNSSAFLRNSDNYNSATANGQWMGGLKAGSTLNIFIETTEAPPPDNSVRCRSRSSNLIVEWVGPIAGGTATIQKVT